MSGVTIFLTLLMGAIIFIIEPGESSLPRLKCWDCRFNNPNECMTNTNSSTCIRGQYCAKFNFKYSYTSDGPDRIVHQCISRKIILDYEYPLNECYEKTDDRTVSRCICDKNDCNSGNEFIPTFNFTTTGMKCLSYKPNRREMNISISTACNKDYYCYKYLIGADENGRQIIERGCIHNKFASRIGVNINQCGEFESDHKKYPFCICNQDNCNSGDFTLTKEVKPTPCPESSNSATNTFQQISLILIWILA